MSGFETPGGRRIGRFSIGVEVINARPAAVTRIMGCCIILRAEAMYVSNRIEYISSCFRFRPVPLGEVIPEYRWIIHDDGDIEAEEIKGPAGMSMVAGVEYA